MEENPTMYSSQFTDKSASMKASRSLRNTAMTVVMFCTWTERPSSEFSGPEEVANLVVDEKDLVNSNATTALRSALSSINSSYDGAEAITVYVVEARNENAYRSLIRPSVQTTLAAISQAFCSSLSSASRIDIPSDRTCSASAITFVGLIYVLVLSFFIVNFCAAARELSGLEKALTTSSLIRVRIASSFVAYFTLSLFYSLLSRAFQVNFSRIGACRVPCFLDGKLVGMLAVGLALEAMMTLMTLRFVAFFMIFWIIVNVSVCFMPIDVLPHIYRYGYAFLRTIVFGTKNQLGMQFGILIAWTAVSMINIPLFQWLMRRKAVSQWRAREIGVKPESF
ncbi:hypothetical protein EDD18DRAFT_1208752 [Armillaria luteobubalina]|uniref:DUF3533 domain-containing protein n=1 Tax=Armillaria luteobubalina TaxID=153913 RepID=A0AA39P6R8_9AGAR|nr:hypothetical protein EDD18DRAFT_1208752 [Armillaria luteobubalina]